jgi:pilus assembly protein CpaC
VRRRLQRNLGLRYPPQINGGQVANFVVNTLTLGPDMTAQAGLINNLMPSLDINESNGFIKIMRVDTVITENGAKATYRSGSELPIRLVGALGAGTLERMFFGSELTVVPRLSIGNEAVSLELTANITAKDTATQDGIPGRTLDFVNTSVHIPMGQSVMLAGLDLRTVGRSTTGLPWLNRIPVFGYLFGSEAKDAESAYGVIYITPTLVQDGPTQFKPYIDKALRYFESPGALPR